MIVRPLHAAALSLVLGSAGVAAASAAVLYWPAEWVAHRVSAVTASPGRGLPAALRDAPTAACSASSHTGSADPQARDALPPQAPLGQRPTHSDRLLFFGIDVGSPATCLRREEAGLNPGDALSMPGLGVGERWEREGVTLDVHTSARGGVVDAITVTVTSTDAPRLSLPGDLTLGTATLRELTRQFGLLSAEVHDAQGPTPNLMISAPGPLGQNNTPTELLYTVYLTHEDARASTLNSESDACASAPQSLTVYRPGIPLPTPAEGSGTPVTVLCGL